MIGLILSTLAFLPALVRGEVDGSFTGVCNKAENTCYYYDPSVQPNGMYKAGFCEVSVQIYILFTAWNSLTNDSKIEDVSPGKYCKENLHNCTQVTDYPATGNAPYFRCS